MMECVVAIEVCVYVRVCARVRICVFECLLNCELRMIRLW